MPIEIKKLERSQIELTAEIPAEEFDSYRSQAIKHLGSHVDLPGFRKGHVPEKMLEEALGEMRIMEEMANRAIQNSFPKIVESEKLDAIGQPEVSVTKMAMGNPLEFKVRVAVVPEVPLPDYKKIAQKTLAKESPVEVTDQEVEDTIVEIQKLHARQAAAAKKDASPSAASASEETEDLELPVFDDAFVKSLGDFKDLADFKIKLRENISAEKTQKAKDKARISMMDAIMAKTTIDLPEVIVAGELDKMMAQMKYDIERMGVTFEDYVRHAKKTEDDMRKEVTPDAEKRAKYQLILNKIAEVEEIKPDMKEAEARVDELLKEHPEANRQRALIYVVSNMLNQAVFDLLENPKS